MKVAIIGPGILHIPPRSWGAVEIIIWNHKLYLERLGHQVDVYNSTDLPAVARAINQKAYDFVHLQYDVYTGFFNAHLTKPFCVTSHYGNLPTPNLWENPYPVFFLQSFSTPGVICLSAKIRALYEQPGYANYLGVLRNGVEFDKFTFTDRGNKKAVCIGNIQPRKRQALLATFADGKVPIDFVGPNPAVSLTDIDSIEGSIDVFSGHKELTFAPHDTCTYLGSWTKEEIYARLSSYSCLVLLSVSEADPLVVKEALAAGLSVIVSESASANLDARDFVTILKEEDMNEVAVVSAIREAIARNNKQRRAIRAYAKEKFDYSVIVLEYLKLIDEFSRYVASRPTVRTSAARDTAFPWILK